MKQLILVLSLLLTRSVFAEPVAYRIDDTHSFANWTIRHVASKTSGTFSDITGKILIDEQNLTKSSINAKINVLSVNSSHAKRDAHIKEPKYLDAEKFSTMTFQSTKIESTDNKEGVVTGNLSLHGVTKEITFPFTLLGFGTDPWGGYRMGLEGKTMIKASDYGFTWTEKTGGSVGDDIEITLLIEGVKLPVEIKALQ